MTDPFKIKTKESETVPVLEPLVHNPFAAFEDKGDPLVPTATLQIYDFIRGYLERPATQYVNRASSATMCFKRRWYQKNGFPAEALIPRKEVNFLLGALSESAILYFVRVGLVGPGKLYSEIELGEVTGKIPYGGKEIETYKQQTLTANVAGIEVTAHVDGWGKRNSDGQWELIECKSAANWGFKDFKDKGPKEYLNQAHVCLMTDKALGLGAKSVRYFYLRKETGHLWDRLYNFDPEIWQRVQDEFLAANAAEEPNAPHVPVFDKKGNRIAQFPCTYCPYLKHCHGEYRVEWKADQYGFSKPAYVFETKKAKGL